MACMMNAANEAAVAAFLKGQIGFYQIIDIVAECMAKGPFVQNPDLDTIFRTNDEAYRLATELINR
jgi:1-deoxy-D-xylulose-5-phosphate reductoisomerase